MNCAFKGFFDSNVSVEVAYFTLKNKGLATDIKTSDLSDNEHSIFPSRIVYGLEEPLMLSSTVMANSVSSPTLLTNNDPRVIMTPILFNKKQAHNNDACFLSGHCRKKDIDAVTACLKRNGAFSVLSSELDRRSRLLH